MSSQMPQTKKTFNIKLPGLIGLVVVVILLSGRLFNQDNRDNTLKSQDAIIRTKAASPSSTSTSTQSGTTLVSGSGKGNGVSRDFQVLAGCARQNLTYELTQTDRDDGWVNFRAVNEDGDGVDSAGPIDIADSPSGTDLWTLSPGTYAIEIDVWHAKWSYKLACR